MLVDEASHPIKRYTRALNQGGKIVSAMLFVVGS